ncbi:Transglutaminase-like enzyme, putative cysteine protease [Devosia lucknowensis]|uniref:Transglutaminase-like enzyme, putative cysteine protease n=1 Tax=Devosia lucknowensis TaxID=1096929 RepID=A0A1Y6EDE9_9HYPH|nr:transglutaminase family protein [Devosia lucknowensis]SMQ58940.1 Transglutaminase-like enzyme, putative cysteine protease [Devosia lucknowensis]
MRIEIDHTLTLSLQPGWNQLMLHLLLTPAAGPTQSVETWRVEAAGIDNAGQFVDAFGNRVHLVNQSRPEGEITIAARGIVVTADTNGVVGKPTGEPVPALYKRVTALTKAPVTVWGKYRSGTETRLDILHGLMGRVGETLGLPEAAPVQMQATGEQKQSQGPTSDEAALPDAAAYAHLFIGAARALDIPARFVVGYLAAAEAGAGGLHAWAEAYDERLGWIGFDPRQQLCPTERYVRLAVGLDAETAVPLRTVPVGELAQSVVAKGI